MSRLPVSVIVTASGSADDFRACLDSLRPTLGVRDEVLCVVPADRTDLHGILRGNPWLRVLHDDSGDQVRRWEAGLAATRHPIVVLLDGDVLVSAHWLDPLAQALDDPEVVAVGPRCHHTYGPQNAELPDEAMERVATFNAYARQWRQENSGRFSTVDALGPVCVAVRRDALDRAGGPTSDLPYERLREQGRIVVAHGALVAHVVTDLCSLLLPDVPDGAPLLSASLIVKDEEEVLAACLTALRDFVDEIVVYDTGSTDRTREIAREHGARVIEGYWNDHFADARNRSLAHCTGQWAFVVDADEIVTGDAASVRAQLAAATRPTFLVGVESEGAFGTSADGRLMSVRIFRRNRARYFRRLHEQVVDRVFGEYLISSQTLNDLTLVHSGYTLLRITGKDKAARNLRLAELSTDDVDSAESKLINLARSQLWAGQTAEAIENCRKGLAENPANLLERIAFLTTLAACYEQESRYDEVRSVLRDLREVSSSPFAADEIEARVCFAEQDFAGALALIQDFPDGEMNDSLFVVTRSRVAEIEIRSLYSLGRHDEAAQQLRESVRDGKLPLSVAMMAEVLRAGGTGIAEVAALLPESGLRTLLLSTASEPDGLVDELLDALWQRYTGSAAVLAGAARIGGRLPLMRAMEWAVRLREHGFATDCALLALAGNPGRSPRERVLAAAMAFELFSDERAMPLLEDALGAVPDDENDRVLQELRQLAPTIAAAIEPAGVA
ncbi:glycosyltransferase [Planosporangium mesophilum]|uniref:glycosyltransferase n=3 Tax=Planosporangium mesophilum TaxID=689768 RepID=UPI001439A3F6|nr:glycosyltransferase [Planosporangium mesophilum]